MSRSLLLQNCRVYDPLHHIDGEIMDIPIRDGKIVDSVPESASRIDLSGLTVMAGGVDIHTHILGSKLNTARAMCPEDHRADPVAATKKTRSGVGFTLPSSFVTGYRYSTMGYTTVTEPAVPPVKALDCWEELHDLTNVDIAMLPMLGNNMITFDFVQQEDLPGLAAYVSWILHSTGGLGVKVVNPGGTYAWAHGKNVRELDTEIPDWRITPRMILTSLCQAVEMLGLPHPLHFHPNNLGKVGNVETTIAQLESLKHIRGHNGRKHIVHLAHISFDALGMVEGGRPEWKDVHSGGLQLAEYANANDHFTVDLGQITFGPATTMTGDGPFQFSLYELTHSKWANMTVDVELPGGAGIVPYTYDPKSPTNAVQWAVSMEYALNIRDIWRCALSTDHPNAGPFTKYPLVLSWLMSKRQRDRWLTEMHPSVGQRSTVAESDREWSLYEVAIATRAAPAVILGLQATKGHLGVGADADIAVYDLRPDDIQRDPDRIVRAFSSAHLTVLGGRVVVKRGEVASTPHGRVWSSSPQVEESLHRRVVGEVRERFSRWYAHSFDNYAVPVRYRAAFETPMATPSVAES
ncbi:MAG: formylmethanofuran dehydrogenase subunit A [Candidatus Thorarchaeota archaeon]|nr:formylmethanofuran dehydrogenase subunit A [Candidatus Thorarchaeota archaeon]